MRLRNTRERYGALAQALHWAVVGLIGAQFLLAQAAAPLAPGTRKLELLTWHKSFGLTILGLALLRLAWRAFDAAPPLPPMARWQRLAARLSHGALYALILALPVSGWLMSSAANHPVTWFGWLELPDFVAPDAGLRGALKRLHQSLAIALVSLAGLHVAAALKHQFQDGDGLLARMLPWPRAPR